MVSFLDESRHKVKQYMPLIPNIDALNIITQDLANI